MVRSDGSAGSRRTDHGCAGWPVRFSREGQRDALMASSLCALLVVEAWPLALEQQLLDERLVHVASRSHHVTPARLNPNALFFRIPPPTVTGMLAAAVARARGRVILGIRCVGSSPCRITQLCSPGKSCIGTCGRSLSFTWQDGLNCRAVDSPSCALVTTFLSHRVDGGRASGTAKSSDGRR